jgi:hypothetical protein
MKLTGGKTCPSATFSTTNPIWTDPGSNPGLRSGRPATNRLSHGTADDLELKYNIFFSEIHICHLSTGKYPQTVEEICHKYTFITIHISGICSILFLKFLPHMHQLTFFSYFLAISKHLNFFFLNVTFYIPLVARVTF